MAGTHTFVIAGAGLAGAKAAEVLRQEGFDGRIFLVGQEPVRPYERPPLSKAYVRGEADFDSAAVHEADFYSTQGIDLLTSTAVTAIDPAGATVSLDSGESLAFDALLLATGAEPRRLSVPGSELAGVRYLRSVADSDVLKRALADPIPVVVIGAGWIGCEIAASARQLGADVSVVEPGNLPLERVLGAEVGAVYRDLHADHGVKLHLGTGVESIMGTGGVEAVRLSDGSRVEAGLVVVGIGVVPRDQIAQAAGLDVANGILTDGYLATSSRRIYAAGDVANVFQRSYANHIRLEHWSAALNQGPVAAWNMLGRQIEYEKVPYFYSDQFDFGMEYRGWADSFDRVVFRGDPRSREFIAFWLRQGVVLAAMNANVWDQGDSLEAIVREASPVDIDRLTDPGVDLGALVSPG